MFLVEQMKGKLDNMKFSNIKKIRKKFNLTQNDICKFLKIAKSTYSSYETGKILIQTQYIYKIAKKFNFSINYILKK